MNVFYACQLGAEIEDLLEEPLGVFKTMEGAKTACQKHFDTFQSEGEEETAALEWVDVDTSATEIQSGGDGEIVPYPAYAIRTLELKE